MVAVFVLTMMTPGSQHTYVQEVKNFRLESIQLDHIIAELKATISSKATEVIAHFLSSCKQI
jgi:hypothetical protein